MTYQERTIRAVRYGLIALGLVMIFAMIEIPVKYATAADPTVGYAITAIALIDLSIGLLGRPFLVRFASYSRQVAKTNPLQRWMIANICSLICLYSCMLFGFVLYILRARIVFVELLFGVALISLLFWRPGTPPNADDAMNTAE
jgi:hypothetical protein